MGSLSAWRMRRARISRAPATSRGHSWRLAERAPPVTGRRTCDPAPGGVRRTCAPSTSDWAFFPSRIDRARSVHGAFGAVRPDGDNMASCSIAGRHARDLRRNWVVRGKFAPAWNRASARDHARRRIPFDASRRSKRCSMAPQSMPARSARVVALLRDLKCFSRRDVLDRPRGLRPMVLSPKLADSGALAAQEKSWSRLSVPSLVP
jgi:hypothetical protein